MDGIEELRKFGSIELQLSKVEVVEAIAEVHDHQIAFVAEHGVQRRLARFFAGTEHSRGLVGNLRLPRVIQPPPFRPAETEHLVQHAQALKRKWNRGQFG